MKAIVYVSNTGHTKAYAMLLSEKLGIPAYELKEAKKVLFPNDEIIYMGWLMAGNVQGYNKAHKLYSVRALCAVGMSGSELGKKQEEEIEKKYSLEHGDVFYLQGGYESKKLSGIYKFMMGTMEKTVVKQLEEKSDKTQEEIDTLDLFKNGGERVTPESLAPIEVWFERNGK